MPAHLAITLVDEFLRVAIILGIAVLGALGIWFSWKVIVRFTTGRFLLPRRGAAVVYYLDQAIHLNLPLVPMLLAAAKSEGGVLAESLEGLAHALSGGATLGAALDLAVPDLSPRARGAIAAG